MQLDHVGLVTRDLVVLRQRWQRLGFAPTDIHELFRMDPSSGERIALGQLSCHADFAGSYIELSEVTSVDRQKFGLFQAVEVVPAVDFSHLEEVLVLLRRPQ